MDSAAQFDLEIDGIGLDRGDLLEIFLEQHVIARIQPRTQATDQRRQRVNGLQLEGLRVSQPPLVETADQQRQTQGPRLVTGAGPAPVGTVRRHLAEHANIRRRIGRRRLAKDAGKNILRHPRRQPLGVGIGQRGELIGGNRGDCGHGGAEGGKDAILTVGCRTEAECYGQPGKMAKIEILEATRTAAEFPKWKLPARRNGPCGDLNFRGSAIANFPPKRLVQAFGICIVRVLVTMTTIRRLVVTTRSVLEYATNIFFTFL